MNMFLQKMMVIFLEKTELILLQLSSLKCTCNLVPVSSTPNHLSVLQSNASKDIKYTLLLLYFVLMCKWARSVTESCMNVVARINLD